MPALSAVSPVTARLWADVVDVPDIIPNGIDLDAWRPGPGGNCAVCRREASSSTRQICTS